MINVYVLCEGKTEKSFIKSVLYPLFISKGIVLIPIVCETKREPSGIKHTGGISTYGKIRNELVSLCRQHPHEFVTMMFDYYRLPHDTPGKSSIPNVLPVERADYLEEQIGQNIGNRNFIPNIVLHEFEGLLFSSPDAFGDNGLSKDSVRVLHEIRNGHDSPEHIDDGDTTAPSKRILAVHPQYNKIIDGVAIASDIGIDKILSECNHFNSWITKIISLRNGVQ
jgi:hypothetical protein